MTSSLHQALLTELADIERQQQDPFLPHSDQQLLDQAWEEVNNRLDELEILFETADEEVDWRDAAAYLESESEDSRPPTPIPAEPVRFAPPPPPISIPQYTGSTGCPPPPRPVGVRICNCDSDGQCAYCEEEELERWNNMVDDRPGCEHCAGCVYCTESRYDGADEI
jgi:hypothetical protein